ncbi:MAG: RNA polymerase sigma factor [Chitinophagaceae bacterium]
MTVFDNENFQLSKHWIGVLEDDTIAFEKIHRILFKSLYNYAVKFLNDEDLADDVIQDLFIKIWETRKKIGNVDKVKSYFFTALRRQMLNKIRNENLRQLKLSNFEEADITFSQEEIVIKRENEIWSQSKVLSLHNQLPARQKEVIYLRYFENLSNQEIAHVMKIHY